MKSELKRLAIQKEMTDAEIKELAITHGAELHGILNHQHYRIEHNNLLAFAKELIVATREKVLAESQGNAIDAAEKYASNYDGDDRECIKTDVLNAFYAGTKYAMPPVPEGMQLVPTTPTPEMVMACRENHEGDNYLPYSLYASMLAAAPKKG